MPAFSISAENMYLTLLDGTTVTVAQLSDWLVFCSVRLTLLLEAATGKTQELFPQVFSWAIPVGSQSSTAWNSHGIPNALYRLLPSPVLSQVLFLAPQIHSDRIASQLRDR